MKRPSKRWSMSSCSFMYTIKALEGSSAFFHPFLHYKVKHCKFNSNSNLKGWIKVHNFHSLRRFGQCQDYAPAQARRKGGAICVWHTLPPAISREDHSSYCSGRHSPAPEPRRRWGSCYDWEKIWDMKQNSEDAMGTKRSAEIHSDEVQRVRVSSARAPRQAKLFCGISVGMYY